VDLRAHLTPRDPRSACRSGGAFAVTGAVLIVAVTLLVPDFAPTGAARLLTLAVAALLLALGAVARLAPHRLPGSFWAIACTATVAAVVTLSLITRDASAAGQVPLTWPMLFAAQELRARAAAVVLVQVVVGDALLVLAVRPTGPALLDLAWVGATAAVFCLLLVRAREHQERLVAELSRQAAVDPLTGLATRRVLDAEMTDALTHGEPTCLLLLDVDGFKLVNDALGHPAGDEVLAHLARQLRVHFGSGRLLVRLGGDELAVLLRGVPLPAALAEAEAFLARLRARPALVEGTRLPVTMSVGATSSAGLAPQPRLLYAAADRALYAAKRAGRDQVRGPELVAR
jgi:diguanylate cyclase (GGDEF)-like protein